MEKRQNHKGVEDVILLNIEKNIFTIEKEEPPTISQTSAQWLLHDLRNIFCPLVKSWIFSEDCTGLQTVVFVVS